MKLKLTLLFLCFSFAARADEPVVLKMKLLDAHGKKAFNSAYFEKLQSAVANMGLVWDEFNPAAEGNLKLAHAKQRQLISPAVPPGCFLAAVAGFITGMPEGAHSLGLTFKGRGCVTIPKLFAKTTVTLRLRQVPKLMSNEVIDDLIIQVTDLPTLTIED